MSLCSDAQGRITNERRNKFVPRRNTSTVLGSLAKRRRDPELPSMFANNLGFAIACGSDYDSVNVRRGRNKIAFNP